MTFLDTNVLVYAVDFRDGRKQSIAERIVEDALRRSDEYAIAVQTLTEFANVALSKLKKSEAEVSELVRVYMDIQTIIPEAATVLRGLDIRKTYGIQFYDAMMISAAQKVGAKTIYTEDLNDGQSYGGVIAVNPFCD